MKRFDLIGLNSSCKRLVLANAISALFIQNNSGPSEALTVISAVDGLARLQTSTQ